MINCIIQHSKLSIQNLRQRLLNILFWSVISAAFIGPGTITSAASAGASYGYALLWALVFSTVACIILQEASARITTVSGMNLGEAIREYLFDRFWGRATVYLILVSILLGCAAYEAGNILGAVAGASLILDVPFYWLTLIIGFLTFLLFSYGSVTQIAKAMGVIVAFMGICFLTTAVIMQPSFTDIVTGGLIPTFPAGSEILILALIGTTVVPYNLFLGSGLASGQSLKEMRLSLGIAIGLGGVISIGVLVVGTAIAGTFTFEALADELAASLGGWAAVLLGLGLFAAGFSSAVTAPLAAAITARSLLAGTDNAGLWSDRGRGFRLVWGVVLLTGIVFGVTEIRPVPAIILAQALNGIILPLVAIFLLLMVNNVRLLDSSSINTNRMNLLMGLVVFITVNIGISNVARALTNSFEIQLVNENLIFISSLVLSALLVWPVWRAVKKLRNADEPEVLMRDE